MQPSGCARFAVHPGESDHREITASLWFASTPCYPDAVHELGTLCVVPRAARQSERRASKQADRPSANVGTVPVMLTRGRRWDGPLPVVPTFTPPLHPGTSIADN